MKKRIWIYLCFLYIFLFPCPIMAETTVHFLDVGQGLSILVQSEGETMLYDGGDANASSFVVAYLKKQNIKQLDYIVASHYHDDHISGLIGCLNVFPTKMLLGPDYIHDTHTFDSFLAKSQEKNLEVYHPAIGESFTLGSATFTVLSPITISDHYNDNSIAILLSDGECSFLFTGDLSEAGENDVLASGRDIHADVLCLGHHGSSDSTQEVFLQAVSPEYAVISCGKDNSYGHPHTETLNKLKENGAKLFRTDLQGTIIASAKDGQISWSVNPCEDAGDLTNADLIDPNPAGPDSANPDPADPDPANPDPANPDPADPVPANPVPASPELTNPDSAEPVQTEFILNTNSGIFHYPDCYSVEKMKPKNKQAFYTTREYLIQQGYSPCGNCNP